ncbi:MAG: EAL domain-containing protein [Cyanobacteria bacterium P01_F01_bin.86]
MTDAKGIILFKDRANIIVEVLTQKIYTIGRFSSNDIFLTSRGVSRSHASIYFLDNRFWIIDGNLKGETSTNGLLVNGQKISIHKLSQYDIVTFCKNVYAIFIEYPSDLESVDEFENTIRNIALFFVGKNAKGDSFSKDKLDIKTLTSRSQSSQLDDLTGLPNRSAFLARISKSLEFKNKISADHQFSILFIDVDRFKIINDSLGHLAGDQFLIHLAGKLQACLRPDDMVARLGGDEFAILVDGINHINEVICVAERLQKEIAMPIQLEKQEVYPSISIGIASSQLQYQTVEEILRDADLAMYNAKKTGKSRFVVFDEEMHQKASELLKLESDLRRAIENQQLQLHYQPIISLQGRTLIGFEALIRWFHPEKGIISPEMFIPLAEETNFIYELGLWTIQEACRQVSIWKNSPSITTAFTMHVNLSSKQLSDTRLLGDIQKILEQCEIKSGELKLEITESLAMEDSQQTIKIANQLKEIGVSLVIDDFGTGYSSLSYLNKFPIDIIKVDRSFVSSIDVTNENTSLNITQSIIGLAHSLGVKVVAEGIEEISQLTYLQQIYCDYGQGYLFSNPVESTEAVQWLKKDLDWRWQP